MLYLDINIIDGIEDTQTIGEQKSYILISEDESKN